MTTTPASASRDNASRASRRPPEVVAMLRRQHGRRASRTMRGRVARVADAERQPVDLLRVLGALASVVDPCQPHRLRWYAARSAALAALCCIAQEGPQRLATVQPASLASWLAQAAQATLAAGGPRRRRGAAIGAGRGNAAAVGGVGVGAGVAGGLGAGLGAVGAGGAGGAGSRVALAGWAGPVLVPSPSTVRAPLVVWRRLAEWLAMHRRAWGDAAWAAGTMPPGSEWAGRPLSWLAWPGGLRSTTGAQHWARSAVQAWCRSAGLPHWSGAMLARAARRSGGWPAGVCRRVGLARWARVLAGLAVATVPAAGPGSTGGG